jgi:long-subunit acyl-CoA synthetase (AMP-forming)
MFLDRKKALLKLSNGEYVSPSQIEMALVSNPLVDQICVCGRTDQNFTVALVVPNRVALLELIGKVSDQSGLE